MRGPGIAVVLIHGVTVGLGCIMLLGKDGPPASGFLAGVLLLLGSGLVVLHRWIGSTAFRKFSREGGLIRRMWKAVGERALQQTYLVIGAELAATGLAFGARVFL